MARGLAEFVAFVKSDETARREVERLAEVKRGRALDEAIVALAAKTGFVFTAGELEAAIEDVLAQVLVDDEIADEELEDVVAEKQGCFIGWIGWLLFGRGFSRPIAPPPIEGGSVG